MKTKKILVLVMLFLQLSMTVHCLEQTVTPVQKRQDIIDDAMKPENYSDLKQNLAFLESQGLLQPHSFYNLLQENITESDDATFNEVIEKAEDLITEHMKGPFISTLERALKENKALAEYIDYTMPAFGTIEIPLFTYVMQHKDNDMALHNIVRGWLLAWSETRQADAPLCSAAYKGRTDITQLLLAAGADVNTVITDKLSTPLYIAARYGHTDIVKILLAAGANLNIQKASHGTSPLYVAAFLGYIDIVRLLFEHVVNADIQTTDGTTPLYFAAFLGCTEIVDLLLAAGANVDSQTTHDGATPLHIAVDQGHTEIVQILVTASADVNIRNHDGRLAQDLAKTDEIRDILRRARQRNNQSQAGSCSIS